MWFRNYNVAHACVVCVKINNEELYFNAFLFENYIILVLDGLRCGAYTGNLSSTRNSSRLCVIFRCLCVHLFQEPLSAETGR